MSSQFVCSSCGYGSASWYGKCPSCNEWNTLKEFRERPQMGGKKGRSLSGRRNSSQFSEAVGFTSLKGAADLSVERKPTGISEFDRVVGGGFVSGQVVLIAGEPGIGKSTLLLSVLKDFSAVYVSGEESAEQVKQRGTRLGIDLSRVFFASEVLLESILSGLESFKESYDVIIIDSIQTIFSSDVEGAMGSVSQVKMCAARLIDFAKRNNKTMIIVGHVTKDGDIAGPKTLEHLVDTVLHLEGEKHSLYRLLRTRKNRFGSTDEVGIFEMKEAGLTEAQYPVSFFETHKEPVVGRALVAALEGSRVLLYEIQSLVVPSVLAMPRRVTAGVDFNRVQILLAVARKNLQLSMDKYDIYVNVVGGVSVKSPSADLGILAAIVSSIKNKPLTDAVYVGEIGLLGEIRNVAGIDKISKEIKRYGFKTVISSKTIGHVKGLTRYYE